MSGAPPPAPGPAAVPPRLPRAAGQGLVEFGLVIGIAAVVAVAVLVLFRPQLAWVLSLIGSEVDKAGWVVGLPALA